MKKLIVPLVIGLSLSTMATAEVTPDQYTDGINVTIINQTKLPIVTGGIPATIEFSYTNFTADKKIRDGHTSYNLHFTKSSPTVAHTQWSTSPGLLTPNEHWNYWTLDDGRNAPRMTVLFNNGQTIAHCSLPNTHYSQGSTQSIVLTLSGNSIARSVACTAQVIN
jgi:hypothetical protein